MYPSNFLQFLMPVNSNLKNAYLKGVFRKHFVQKYGLAIRQKLYNLKKFEEINKKFQDILKKGQLFKLVLENPITPRSSKNSVVNVWVHHCECVFAQRLRRFQQMFTLYSKWWEEKAMRDFIKKMKQNLTKRGKELTLASVAVYNWDQNRIPIEEIKSNEKEVEYISVLKDNTICLACDRTQRNNNGKTCVCGTSGHPTDKTYDDWTVFIEKSDLVVWRRLHPSGSGQYEYKLFGSYNDITAEDFLNVQIDIDYRRKWDTTAVVLEQGERDPQENANSDIIYWEMLWPRLFVNRDYVFNRRYVIDEEKKLIYIVSKSTEHPAFPKHPDKYRIEDYWSCMVIMPYDELDKPGVEFILTYYDNPGVNIPSTVTTWVAMRAMPDFLDKLRDATKNYRDYCIQGGTCKACRILPKEVKELEFKREKEKLDYCNLVREAKNFIIQHAKGECKEEENGTGNNKDNDKDKDSGNSSDVSSAQQNTPECTSFLKYLHPLYYFH